MGARTFEPVLSCAGLATTLSGVTAREEIIDVDDKARRVAWAIIGGRFSHSNGSAQVFGDDAHGSRFVWTVDLLPNDLAAGIAKNVEAGLAVIKRTMESRVV